MCVDAIVNNNQHQTWFPIKALAEEINGKCGTLWVIDLMINTIIEH